MKQKVLVTGGAGYIGSVLVPKLIEKQYDVRVLDLMIFGEEVLDPVKDKCEIIKGDIRNNETLKQSLSGINAVIHLAAISNDPCSDLDPKLTKEVNYDAIISLVNISKELGVSRFIAASSSSVYGVKKEEEVTEDLSLEPLTLYSILKAESEKIMLEAKSENFSPVCIRSATVCGYSPRQRLDVVVNILTAAAITKKEITVFGGDQKRPNIHIDDITNLYVDLLEVPNEKISGQVFNYGDTNYTINELANLVVEVIGNNIKINQIPETNDPRSYSISSNKIKDILGFYPKKTIKDAIRDLKNAFEKGLLEDPNDSKYSNIKKMKEINLR